MRRRDHLPLLRLIFGALAVALLAAAACTQSAERTQPQTTSPGAVGAPGLAWESCGDGIECATFTVPLDHGAAESTDEQAPTIEIALARRPAGDPAARIGSLLVNPGGPGGSGIEMVRGRTFDHRLAELAQRFDIVGWDPRGVGQSTPVACGAEIETFFELDPSPDTEAEQAELEDAARRIAESCAEHAGELLPHLSLEATALDIEAIRQALGEEQISYLGFSYGTLIGQEYARLFPQRVRAMTLDGVVDAALTLAELLKGQAVGAEEALAPLTQLYDEVSTKVEAAPLPNPGGPPVGPARLALAAVASNYLPDGASKLRDALERAAAGEVAALSALADHYLSMLDNFDPYLAISCVDTQRPHGMEEWRTFVQETEVVAPRLGSSMANELLPCAAWPALPTREASPAVPDRLVPVLVIGNTGDVATPLSNAQAVAERLPGAVLVTVHRDGHTAAASDDCASRIVVEYFLRLALPEPGATC